MQEMRGITLKSSGSLLPLGQTAPKDLVLRVV